MMMKWVTFLFLFLLSLVSPLLAEDDHNALNVMSYGAEGDGKTDDTKVKGTIVAPSKINDYGCDDNKCEQWIMFSHLNGFTLYGNGVIDAQGSDWWSTCDYSKHFFQRCPVRPTAVKITDCNNAHVKDLQIINSAQMHVVIHQSAYVYLNNVKIIAPEDSPNTDGDDCISIGTGTSELYIYKIRCGPGHGISIGSLGKNGSWDTVENISVSHVDFWGTTNGVRIKTWQGGNGYARNITFEKINVHNARNPIIIDQFYCDHTHCKNQASAVQISDISYRQVKGTSERETAVNFACSESVPCKGIVAEDISIKAARDDQKTSSYCLNVQGTGYGKIIPTVPCLGYSNHS
ncbi:hypothetical protein GIB67_033021 [Kingdonia uniflora]|uniref:Endo-polygalacturonase n=1 Tax=Kingdonia uniflora TaxID=39325 RepID=A0A7J7MYL1_9MAGN|nr:hypothetical protein GIB67_033021 [Kingdonia uniflora]